MAAKTKSSKGKYITVTAKEGPLLPANTETLLSKAQIGFAIGVSVRTLQTMLASGEYPKPDTHLGKFPRWSQTTHNEWVRVQAAKDKERE